MDEISNEGKCRLKIYRLKDHILVHHLSPQKRYELYMKGVEPFKQIDEDGHTTSDYDVRGYVKDNYIVHCPSICKDFPILVNSTDLKEINLNDSKELYEFMEYLGYFSEKANKYIKNFIKVALEID